MTNDDIITQCTDILSGAKNVRIEPLGRLWLIGCKWGDQSHAGAREDPLSLARDLARFADLAPPIKPPADHEEAGVAAPPAPAAPAASSLDTMLASGTMLVEDELSLRRQRLAAEIPAHCTARIDAAYDATRRNDIAQTMQRVIDCHALGLPVGEDEATAYDEAMQQNAWIRAQERYRDQLLAALPHCTLEMLRNYDLDNAGWP